MFKITWETRAWYGKETPEVVRPGKYGRLVLSCVFDYKTAKTAEKHVLEFSSLGATIIETEKV